MKVTLLCFVLCSAFMYRVAYLLSLSISGDTDVVLELSSELSQALQDNGHIQLSVLCTMQVGLEYMY